METILSNDERQQYFGADEKWKSGENFDYYDKQGRELFDQRVTEAVENNKGNGTVDILLATFGYGNKAIVDATGLVAIETGIGYGGTFARFRVYESYAWLHVLNGDTHVNHYHTVIPNCYYPSEFEGAQPSVQGRYLVFVSRLIEVKGIQIALQILEHMPKDYTLHMAGQGDISQFVPKEHPLFDRVIHHGVLKPKERNDLVIGAEAILLPTLYREPFGGAVVEAQMLGTPAITTDHAAFAETVWHGVTGYRCGTLRCFVAAAKQAHLLDRDVIARRAKKVYDCDLVQYQYEDYFQDVLNLWDPRGWSLMDGGAGHTLDQRDFYDFYPTSLEMNESCEAIGPIKKGTNASYGKADGRSSNSSLPLSSFQRSMR
jgi:glycosyltransferase involved in cell wall biosynthesis